MRTARYSSSGGGICPTPPGCRPLSPVGRPLTPRMQTSLPPEKTPKGGLPNPPDADLPPPREYPPGSSSQPPGCRHPLPPEADPPAIGRPRLQADPSPCEQTDRCKHTTLPQTSFAGGNYLWNVALKADIGIFWLRCDVDCKVLIL